MRYVCYKMIVSKVVDEQVTQIETIKALIKIFKEKELSCAMQVDGSPVFNSCRVVKIGDDKFEFLIVGKTGSLKKTAEYAKIDYLELKTDDQTISVLKPNSNRWLLLDNGSDE